MNWGAELNLQVNLLEEDNVQIFKVIGEVDAFTAPILKERLASVQNIPGLQAELDLSEVAYIDSTGLGIFVGFYKVLKGNDGHVKITGVNKRLKRLFEITGLDGVLEIVEKEGANGDESL